MCGGVRIEGKRGWKGGGRGKVRSKGDGREEEGNLVE